MDTSTTTPIRPAEVFHPGEYIKDEIEARGWFQRDLAEIMDLDPTHLSGIIKGRLSVNAQIAVALGKALGTEAEIWINLNRPRVFRRLV